jgi:pyruvate dehydrogenase (quinone)
MATTVGDFILRRLWDWGVRRVYGYPGDGINGIVAAFGHKDTVPTFTQVRHEEMAALMACGHAKYTGEVGVCLATSGPGAIHLLNGLYDARMDHMPVVAIVGQAARASIGGSYQQEVDLPTLFKDVARDYVHLASHPAQVRHLIDRAVRIAQAERTVTCVIVPKDVQELEAVHKPPHAHGTLHSGLGYVRPRVLPPEDQLRQAADILNSGRKVAMLVGAGAMGAGAEVVQVAERLGAGVAKALLGKAVVPDDLPYVTGPIGLLGSKPSYKMMTACDTLFMVGSGFPYPEFLPEEGQARGVQIDLAADMLSLRYPMDVALQGDARETLRALLPLLEPRRDDAWRQEIESEVRAWWELLDRRARVSARPINPEQVFQELSPRLPDGCILAADSGASATWFARNLKMRAGMKASISGSLATMGSGMPYAIAAKFAFPDRPVVAIVGDGAMQMNGMNELITVGKYWRQWTDPRLVVLVLNNRDLNMVTWEMRVMSGDPKYTPSQELPDFPYASVAEAAGLRGRRVERPEEVAAAWDAAFLADRPMVIDAMVDPDVPPLPPHISWDQAKKYSAALLRGDPDAGGVIRQSLKEMFA